MNIKIFEVAPTTSVEDIEEKINKWFNDRPYMEIDIKQVNQIIRGDYLLISVWYKAKYLK